MFNRGNVHFLTLFICHWKICSWHWCTSKPSIHLTHSEYLEIDLNKNLSTLRLNGQHGIVVLLFYWLPADGSICLFNSRPTDFWCCYVLSCYCILNCYTIECHLPSIHMFLNEAPVVLSCACRLKGVLDGWRSAQFGEFSSRVHLIQLSY